MTAPGHILWLTEKKGITSGFKFVLDAILKKEELTLSQIYFMSVRDKNTKIGEMNMTDLEEVVDDYIDKIKPKLIVCNDEETLKLFTGGTLFFCRGSVYEYKGRTVLILADTSQWINTTVTVRGKIRSIPGRWVLINDIQKLSRWMHGKQRQQPKFTYTICRNFIDLCEAKDFLLGCHLISEDIETHPGKITVVGFTGYHPSGRLHTYVIPFYNPFKPNSCHWQTDGLEICAWEVVKAINSCAAVKTMQGGSYDTQYLLKYRIAPYNYILDSFHLFHSIFTEAPKKLNFIASILLDYCRFWKDESKGDDDGGAEHKGKFKDVYAYERYLRYNGLDCYNTLLSTLVLVRLIVKLPWAVENYRVEFLSQIGPANAGSVRGLQVNTQRQAAKRYLFQDKSNVRLGELRTMADDPEFNPGSPKQLAHFLYNTLGAKRPELKGKNKNLAENSVSEIILKVVRNDPTQLLQPIFETVIDKVFDYKKPKNNISKYGNMKLSHDNRWYYSLGAGATETGRWNSRRSNMDMGNQVQNVPLQIRDMVVADPGYIFFEPDFSQSDLWFMAYASGDQRLINNLLSGKDMHCLHGSFFFKIPEDEFVQRYREGDLFISGEPTGLRYITKRIVHGKSYEMAGFTLYLLMGRAACVAAAKALGHKNAGEWGQTQLAHFCQGLLNAYDIMYPRLAAYKKEVAQDAIKNGNKITVARGRTRLFFGDLANDKNVGREAMAYVGQGGTAGNTNEALIDYYYRQPELSPALFMTQTHDSTLLQLPVPKLHTLANKFLTILQKPVELNGQTFTVPTAAKVGFSWGPGPLKAHPLVMKYSRDLNIQTLFDNEQKVFEYYNEIIVSRGNEEIKNDDEAFFTSDMKEAS